MPGCCDGLIASSCETDPMSVMFEPVVWPADSDDIIAFLTANEWPFHGVSRLSEHEAAHVRVAGDDLAAFWIREAGAPIGLIRVFDLNDVDEGSPVFDVRIAERHRGRGVGRAAVSWLTKHLFTSYAGLHRVEASTRADNMAMQAVLTRCGYRQEGRLVEAWKNADGTWSDTLLYGIVRDEVRRVSSP
jgi:RimJ/RimL family protein N-acetyltransferase